MSHRINVFLSDDEYKIIDYAAQMANIKKPQAIKRMALSNIENFHALTDLKPELEKLVIELGRQGNNLYQATRMLNKGIKPTAEILRTIEKTNEQFAKVLIFRNEIIQRLINRKL